MFSLVRTESHTHHWGLQMGLGWVWASFSRKTGLPLPEEGEGRWTGSACIQQAGRRGQAEMQASSQLLGTATRGLHKGSEELGDIKEAESGVPRAQ